MKLINLLLVFVAVSAQAEIKSEAACRGCADLRKVITEFKRAPKSADFDTLQLKATVVIGKMPGKDKKLTDEQVREVVEAFRLSVPKDPAGAIVTNNFEIVKANLSAIEKALEKIQKSEKDVILDAIAANQGEEERGNDPAPEK